MGKFAYECRESTEVEPVCKWRVQVEVCLKVDDNSGEWYEHFEYTDGWKVNETNEQMNEWMNKKKSRLKETKSEMKMKWVKNAKSKKV